MEMQKTRFHFPINSALVIEIAIVFMVIAVVYIVFGYLGNLDMVSEETAGYINDTILMWVTVVGVIMLAVKSILLNTKYSQFHSSIILSNQHAPQKEINNYANTLTRWRVCHQPFPF